MMFVVKMDREVHERKIITSEDGIKPEIGAFNYPHKA